MRRLLFTIAPAISLLQARQMKMDYGKVPSPTAPPIARFMRSLVSQGKIISHLPLTIGDRGSAPGISAIHKMFALHTPKFICIQIAQFTDPGTQYIFAVWCG